MNSDLNDKSQNRADIRRIMTPNTEVNSVLPLLFVYPGTQLFEVHEALYL